MRVIDLFAGGGGASLGWHRAGWDVMGVEWWDVAARVHDATGIPCVTADVRDHGAWMHLAEPVTGLIASPPCQAWSSAGRRLGARDERNGWPWLLGAVGAMRSAGVRVPFMIAENVEGMTHHPKAVHPDPVLCPGCYLDTVVAEVGRRWPHAGVWRLDAADYGVPQHRRRIFVWGSEVPLSPPPRTHHPTGGMLRPWWVGADTVVGDGLVGHRKGAGCAERHGVTPPRPSETPAPAITAGARGGCPIYIWAAGRTGMGRPRDTASPAPTLTSAGNAWLSLGRRITPEEAAALQGWPDCPLDAARTQEERYRVVGNAVPPPMAEAIAREVRRCLDRAPP